MVCKFFDKKSLGGAGTHESMPNRCPSDIATVQLAQELQKSVIRKFENKRVY